MSGEPRDSLGKAHPNPNSVSVHGPLSVSRAPARCQIILISQLCATLSPFKYSTTTMENAENAD